MSVGSTTWGRGRKSWRSDCTAGWEGNTTFLWSPYGEHCNTSPALCIQHVAIGKFASGIFPCKQKPPAPRWARYSVVNVLYLGVDKRGIPIPRSPVTPWFCFSGEMHGYLVGSEGRWEYLVAGDPLRQIGEAEPEAKQGEVRATSVWP